MSVSTPNVKPAPAAPAGKAIDILSTPTAQLFANLHPILLLSVILFSFRSLVADPVNTLLGLAPTTLILQTIYCIVCLPSSGQTPPPKAKPGQKVKPAKPQDVWDKLVVCHPDRFPSPRYSSADRS